MDKIKKEDFEKWVEEGKWLQISEAATPKGRQVSYLTPAGNFIIAIFNINGELEQVIKPMPAAPQAMPMRQFPSDLRGGAQHPVFPG